VRHGLASTAAGLGNQQLRVRPFHQVLPSVDRADVGGHSDAGADGDLDGRETPEGMAGSTITAKGQTTVPADIRAFVDAKPGTRMVWSAMRDGTIVVRAKTKSILDMASMLKAPKGKHAGVDDMNPWR
jgi:AbrB family looped-hinge helix DNA binding protein